MSNQPPSTYSRLTNASARLTHRRIFPQASPSPTTGNDMHRIAAKIRQLQDDVRAILGENSQYEQENRQLISVLEQVQFVVAEQQARIDELTMCLKRDAEAGETIAQYQQDLGTVAEQIGTLNELIQTKNEQFEELRIMKEEELYRNMRLKEQSNHLLYQHNALLHELDQLVDEEEGLSHHSQSFHDDPEEKMQTVLMNCERLASRVQQLRASIEKTRRESNERAAVEKQKRIRLEYEVRLLRQRKSDQTKKEGYFKGFYDEERIQSVIDDMLQKEDSIRAQIAEQEEATREAAVQWEEQLENKRKNGNREILQREEQARLLQLQIGALQDELKEALMRLAEITQKVEIVEVQGIEMAEFQQNMDSEIYQRIRSVEEENLLLQAKHQELALSVQQLQEELTH